MSRARVLLLLIFRAAWVKKDRALTALVSIAVVATMATVALTVYSGLEGEFTSEFRSFGANVIITSPHELTSDDVATIKAAAGTNADVVPVGYAIAYGDDGAPVVIGGTDLAAFENLNSWWSLERTQNSAVGEGFVGWRAASAVPSERGNFNLTYNHQQVTVHPGRIVHSGSDDDSRLYLTLKQFSQLTGMQPNTAQLRIPGTAAEISRRVGLLQSSLPRMEVKPVRQVTAAQTAVLSKTRGIVLAASAIVVVLIVICMVATLTGSVLERRKDFAVMKALGASNRAVNLIFAGEATLTSLVGASVGFIAGSGIALWIGEANFGAAILPRIQLLPPVMLVSVIVALIAAAAPLKILRRIQPAGILRGE